MSANINEYVGRQAAWHEAGFVTGQHMTWSGMVELTPKLFYNVYKDQLEYNGQKIDQWGTFRADNGAYLGPVGKDYAVIQHMEGFKMIDALMQSQDGAHYETAGVLGKGEIVWGLADLSLSINVGDDESKLFLLFSTSHNGTLGNDFRLTAERVVCENTLMAALRASTRACFNVRHTKNFQEKLDKARLALAEISAEALSMEQKLNFLAQRTVTKDSLETIMSRLFPNEKDENGAAVYSTRTRHTLETILANFESNDKGAFPEQKDTAYSLLNAITDFTDHTRNTHNQDNGGRAESALFGSGAKLKTQAFEVIMQAANGMPIKSRTVYAPIPAVAPSANGSLLDAVLDAHGV